MTELTELTAATTTASGPAPLKTSAPRLRTTRRLPTPGRPKRSVLLTVLTAVVLIYSLLPLVWLLISATKTQNGLARSFGLWFDGDFALWDNISQTLTYHDGVFLRWLLNTLLYVLAGAGVPPFWRSSAVTRWPSSTSPESVPCSRSSSVPWPYRAPPSPSRPS